MLEVPEHKRESFLLESPAMVGRSSARNLRRNLLLIFSERRDGGELSRASGLLDASRACTAAGNVSLFPSMRAVARRAEARGRWWPSACSFSVPKSLASLCV